jgi:putative FmdB family regulatory protein
VPTYEYACRGCGQHLEVVQSFKDDALTECPSCEGELRKVYSAAGLIFKGSGWHVKDYATSSRSSSSSSSSDGGSSGSSDSGSSGSSDSGSPGSGSSTSATSSASSTSSSADKKSA